MGQSLILAEASALGALRRTVFQSFVPNSIRAFRKIFSGVLYKRIDREMGVEGSEVATEWTSSMSAYCQIRQTENAEETC